MRTTAILNLKGGVGKTATTVNMAAILAADYHKRVLVVDADRQTPPSSSEAIRARRAFRTCCAANAKRMTIR